MKLRILLAAALLLTAGETASAGKVRHPVTAKHDATVVYTGYVDQHDSTYVLVGGEDLQFEAVLEPGAFKNDYFANFIGQRVIVHARLIQSGTRPVLRVMSIRLAPEEQEFYRKELSVP